MPSITPFSLQVTELTNLGQDRAVEAFRRLLWAESSKVGIGKHIINVPQCINTGDGGIDAFIQDATPTSDEIIPTGISGFQIKSSGIRPADCKKELHVDKDTNKPLKPEVKKILDEDGTYVLVLFADLPSPHGTNPREQAIKEELTRLGYQNPKIRLYTANQLSGFIEQFPSLVTWFKNDLTQCKPYSSWAEDRDIKIPKLFIPDDIRKTLSEDIQSQLRDPKGQCLVFRVMGLSGIGKTRFVFETLAPDDLKARVIYVRADSFRLSNLYQTIQNDQNLSVIIVIDECDLQQHEEFVRSFSARGERLALLTLSYEIGDVPSPSLPFKITKLSQNSVEQILKAEASALPEDVVRRLGQFADGYPRIAVLLGESYLLNREGGTQENFLEISDEALMNRLVGGRDTSSDYFRKTKKVLQELSLFSKIGYEGILSKEAEWVAETIDVSWDDFKTIISEQKKRGIIQGQNYIYVTPFMLRIHLLKEWWKTFGFTKEKFKEFVESIPEQFRNDLMQRFFENIPYISTIEKGKEFIKDILGGDGPFSDPAFLKTKLGADFFLNLTEADPVTALKYLQSTVGKWNRDELLDFKEGRRQIVWALERMAVWKNLFKDSARLLLNLGVAENESYSNSASGVFIDLFSPGPGGLAPTGASPEERFPVLQEALNSGSKEKRMIALSACDKALEANSFVRMVGPEYQGLREAQLWKPESREEIMEAYSRIWQLLYSSLEKLPEDEQKRAVEIMLNNIRGLIPASELANMVLDDITALADKPYGNKKEIIKTIEEILHYDRKELPDEIKQQWEKLRDNLVGNDFSSLMMRYVGMDVLEDNFDDNGNRVDKAAEHIKDLAHQVMVNNDLLKPELPWLVTHEAKNGFRFSYELGLQDQDFTLLPLLLDAQRQASDDKNTSDYFLGGYLKTLSEKNPEQWEKVLDELSEDKKLGSWISGLTWRSGMSDRAAVRILKLAQNGILKAKDFRVFGLGSVIKNLSEKVFKEWIEFLLETSDDIAASIALDLYHFYYIRKDAEHKLPKDLTLKLLTNPSLFKKPEEGRRDQMEDHNWTEISNRFIELYPEDSLQLADTILEHFGEDGTVFEGYHSPTTEVINNISSKNPNEMWKRVTKFLGPPIDSRSFHLTHWLREKGFFEEKEGSLSSFNPESVWEWVNEDPEKRAWYLATFVPKVLFKLEGKTCWARELLVKFGERKDVRNELTANFSSEGWTGSASQHYQQKKDNLLSFKEGENNENVKQWINDFVASLDKQIEYEKMMEERMGF